MNSPLPRKPRVHDDLESVYFNKSLGRVTALRKSREALIVSLQFAVGSYQQCQAWFLRYAPSLVIRQLPGHHIAASALPKALWARLQTALQGQPWVANLCGSYVAAQGEALYLSPDTLQIRFAKGLDVHTAKEALIDKGCLILNERPDQLSFDVSVPAQKSLFQTITEFSASDLIVSAEPIELYRGNRPTGQSTARLAGAFTSGVLQGQET